MEAYQKRVMALAAMYQCAQLVHSIAVKGVANLEDFKAVKSLLFAANNESFNENMKNISSYRTGLLQLRKQLAGEESEIENLEVTRYVISLISLEKVFSKDFDLLEQVVGKVETVREGAQEKDLDEVIESLAAVYTEGISALQPRIRVKGSKNFLSSGNNAARVRCILLAGLRIAMYWRYVGGRRWHLFFLRKRYISVSEDLIRSCA